MYSKSVVFLLMFLACVTALADGAGAENIAGVGLRKLDVVDPIKPEPMDTVTFFPSPDTTGTVSFGPYPIDGSRSAPIGNGRYPLIVISHGNLGSLWGHHDLASALARQGSIVVSLTHPGDNFRDAGRIGTTSVLYGRPAQISAALTAALADPVLAPHIDPARIGFVGFSAGGTTGLILAGAKPDVRRLETYCAKRPHDRHVCEAKGRIRTDRADLTPLADPRIRSLVLLAPLSVLFPPEELAAVTVPVLIVAGGKDEELATDENAGALARALPPANRLDIIPDAGHFSFLAPCSAELARAAPALCTDPPGIDRNALHHHINDAVAAFFAKVLAAAAP